MLEQEKNLGALSRVILHFNISEPLFEQQGLHFVSEQVQSTQQMYVFVFCPWIIFKYFQVGQKKSSICTITLRPTDRSMLTVFLTLS